MVLECQPGWKVRELGVKDVADLVTTLTDVSIKAFVYTANVLVMTQKPVTKKEIVKSQKWGSSATTVKRLVM